MPKYSASTGADNFFRIPFVHLEIAPPPSVPPLLPARLCVQQTWLVCGGVQPQHKPPSVCVWKVFSPLSAAGPDASLNMAPMFDTHTQKKQKKKHGEPLPLLFASPQFQVCGKTFSLPSKDVQPFILLLLSFLFVFFPFFMLRTSVRWNVQT